MSHLVSFTRAYIRSRIADERGANAIEYGLVAALVALVIVIGASALGVSLGDLFTNSSTALDNADPS